MVVVRVANWCIARAFFVIDVPQRGGVEYVKKLGGTEGNKTHVKRDQKGETRLGALVVRVLLEGQEIASGLHALESESFSGAIPQWEGTVC
jgi:hypothetical protein